MEEIEKEGVRELLMEGLGLEELKGWGKGFEGKGEEESVRDGRRVKIEGGNGLFVWGIGEDEVELGGCGIEGNESNK